MSEEKALTHAYRVMMGSEAWKDLEKYALEERELSVKRGDDKSSRDLVIGEVCEEIGIRKGLRKILRHAQERSEGL